MTKRMIENFPKPWRAGYIEMPPTRKCHHKTRTWVIYDASGRRIFWTEAVVREICEIVNNANAATAD